jgi:nitroreductase
MTEVLDLIFNRRSIRKFQEREVERELLIQLLQAAMAAPSACNNQPWEFVVVTEKEKMDELRSRLIFGRYNAPAAIAVLGNPSLAIKALGKDFWVQDCSAAVENLLIAAAGLGLGAVWLGVHPVSAIVKDMREVLQVPESVTPLAVIYVGYPAESKPPRTQYKEERVHWQHY